MLFSVVSKIRLLTPSFRRQKKQSQKYYSDVMGYSETMVENGSNKHEGQ